MLTMVMDIILRFPTTELRVCTTHDYTILVRGDALHYRRNPTYNHFFSVFPGVCPLISLLPNVKPGFVGIVIDGLTEC